MKALHQHPESAPLLRCRFLIGQAGAAGPSFRREVLMSCQLLHCIEPDLSMARFNKKVSGSLMRLLFRELSSLYRRPPLPRSG